MGFLGRTNDGSYFTIQQFFYLTIRLSCVGEERFRSVLGRVEHRVIKKSLLVEAQIGGRGTDRDARRACLVSRLTLFSSHSLSNSLSASDWHSSIECEAAKSQAKSQTVDGERIKYRPSSSASAAFHLFSSPCYLFQTFSEEPTAVVE